MPRDSTSQLHPPHPHHQHAYSSEQRIPHRRRKSRDLVVVVGANTGVGVAVGGGPAGQGLVQHQLGTTEAQEILGQHQHQGQGAGSGTAAWGRHFDDGGNDASGSGSGSGSGIGNANGSDSGVVNGNGGTTVGNLLAHHHLHLDPALPTAYTSVDSAEGFWAEIDALLTLPDECGLTELDNTLRMFVRFCAAYHDLYLRDPSDMHQAVELLLESELFEFHYERMVGIMMGDAQENTNPHELYIWYHIILYYGKRHPSLFRSHRRWYKLLPTLGEVVGLDCEETFVLGLPPIESRIRLPATTLMYEVCRVQKLSPQELQQFDDTFIDHLFELVETTRDQQDERLNYAVISLIVALNEQFMVATLPKHRVKSDTHRHASGSGIASAGASTVALPAVSPVHASSPPPRPRAHSVSPTSAQVCNEEHVEDAKKRNRVLVVLMRRLGLSKTFGENVIFMLNRAEDTPEGMCMQLLILKILYLLFTTPGTQEYFFTNDLRVLLDVFIRELIDLPEEHEALRHTYLRVLYPLLCHTQLRHDPYKRPQIKLVLQSLIANEHIREVGATTKRLVERCLNGLAETANGRPPNRSSSDPHPASPIAAPTRQMSHDPDTRERQVRDSNHLSPEAAKPLSLCSVAAALPSTPTVGTIYTSRDPVRATSLLDVSDALDNERPARPSSVASTAGGGSPVDRSQASTPLNRIGRRKPPAPPPKRKNSTSTVGSMESGTDVDDLVKTGERGVPPPIIEVQPTKAWIQFTA